MINMPAMYVSFTKADLAHLDDGQLKIVCVFPHITNRLKVLESHVYSHMNVVVDHSEQRAKRDIAICAFIESMILIAGDLKEGWEAIQQCYYGTKVSKTMHATLPEQIQACLKRLPAHFSGDSLASFLRNHFAFHNSPDVVLDTIKTTPGDEEMGFYVLDESIFYYDFATTIRFQAIAKRLNLADRELIVKRMSQEIMGSAFNDLYLSMIVITDTIVQTVKTKRESLEVTNIPSDKELRSEVFSHLSSIEI